MQRPPLGGKSLLYRDCILRSIRDKTWYTGAQCILVHKWRLAFWWGLKCKFSYIEIWFLKKSNTPRTYPSKEIKEPQRAFTPRRAGQLQHKDGLQIPLAMRSDFSQEHLLGRAKSVPPCSLWSGWGSAQHKGVGFSSSIPSNPIGWKHPSNPKALKTTTWYNKIKRYCLDMNEKKKSLPSSLLNSAPTGMTAQLRAAVSPKRSFHPEPTETSTNQGRGHPPVPAAQPELRAYYHRQSSLFPLVSSLFPTLF